MSGPYGLYMYALETCACSKDMCMPWRHVSAPETWYMLLGHGICCMDMGHVFLWDKNVSSCERRICLLVGEEYMVSSCWIRIYGYGRCILVG